MRNDLALGVAGQWCRTTPSVALLSIHPRFAAGILNGSKRVELRRTGFAHAPRYVVVYATQPIGKVVGVFEVGQIVDDSPTKIWQRYFAVSGLEREEYDRYYRGASKAVAIEIATVHELSIPVPLSQLGPALQPPQSFQYLPAAALRKLGLGQGDWRPRQGPILSQSSSQRNDQIEEPGTEVL